MSTIQTRNDSGVLLDAGTNETEILVFQVNENYYGVNVAKVREVLPVEKVTVIPRTHSAVDGLVRVREYVVPLVNLGRFLSSDFPEDIVQETMLLLEFNDQQMAFRLQNVDRIYRLSWNDAAPLPKAMGTTAPVTSIIKLENRLVQILDFETIANCISGKTNSPKEINPEHLVSAVPEDLQIVLAEDSHMIAMMVTEAVKSQGFPNVRHFIDGQEAWDYLVSLKEGHDKSNIRDTVSVLISDIEMPRMDGFTLTRKVRGDNVLEDLPVVLFSSIVSPDNIKKGEQVGATAQISKPKYDELAATLAKLLRELLANGNQSAPPAATSGTPQREDSPAQTPQLAGV